MARWLNVCVCVCPRPLLACPPLLHITTSTYTPLPNKTAEGLRKKKKRKKQPAAVTGGVRVVEEDEWGAAGGGGGRGQDSEGEGDGALVGWALGKWNDAFID